MIIHTLGPAETDSCEAASDYLRHQCDDGRLVLHDSFESVINHLDAFVGDFLLIPAAFKSSRRNIDWADVHYGCLEQLKLVDCFHGQLDPLVLVRRKDAAHAIAYTHPATAALLKKYLQNSDRSVEIRYTDSKYLAYQNYRLNHAQLVVTNKKIISLGEQETIEKTYAVDMVWCVYKILKRSR